MPDLNPPEPGIHLVATPIGNMEDITLRALRILRSADVLACEDTRVTRRLFERHGLAAPRMIFSCHDHNERTVAKRLADMALGGNTVACCSDAGTPGISDPGFHIVREALRTGARLEVIPGPNAMITAAALSGLAGGAFSFFGFPSRRDGRLRALLRRHGGLGPALLCHESPRRLVRLLTLAAEIRRRAAGGGLPRTDQKIRTGNPGKSGGTRRRLRRGWNARRGRRGNRGQEGERFGRGRLRGRDLTPGGPKQGESKGEVMIYSDIGHFRGEFSSCRALRQALDFLAEKAFDLPDGKHELTDGMLIQIRRYDTGPAAGRRYETHIKMADIQSVLEGREILYTQPLPNGAETTEDHLADRDLRFHDRLSDADGMPLALRPGLFALLIPDDAHKPECFDGVKNCRKAIVKIPVGLLGL